MGYQFYRLMHSAGLLMLFFSLGGLTMHVINGGTRTQKWRKQVAITHGIGLFLLLVSGFGMLGALEFRFSPFPAWVLVKVIAWLVFGGFIAVVLRKPNHAKLLWWAIPCLGVLAGYMALYKPF